MLTKFDGYCIEAKKLRETLPDVPKVVKSSVTFMIHGYNTQINKTATLTTTFEHQQKKAAEAEIAAMGAIIAIAGLG